MCFSAPPSLRPSAAGNGHERPLRATRYCTRVARRPPPRLVPPPERRAVRKPVSLSGELLVHREGIWAGRGCLSVRCVCGPRRDEAVARGNGWGGAATTVATWWLSGRSPTSALSTHSCKPRVCRRGSLRRSSQRCHWWGPPGGAIRVDVPSPSARTPRPPLPWLSWPLRRHQRPWRWPPQMATSAQRSLELGAPVSPRRSTPLAFLERGDAVHRGELLPGRPPRKGCRSGNL